MKVFTRLVAKMLKPHPNPPLVREGVRFFSLPPPNPGGLRGVCLTFARGHYNSQHMSYVDKSTMYSKPATSRNPLVVDYSLDVVAYHWVLRHRDLRRMALKWIRIPVQPIEKLKR
jgi:hypothetical protein